jgi:hypothetical protein
MTTWIMDLSDTDPSSTSAKLRRTMKFWLVLLLALTICVSCDQPSASLVGKWEADTSKVRPVQIEFLADGSVIENEKVLGKWQQVGTGSFKFISPTRIKVDLQPSWYFGATIYEVTRQDQDHLNLRAGDKTIQLSLVKP